MDLDFPDYIMQTNALLNTIGESIGWDRIPTMDDEAIAQAFRLIGVLTPEAMFLLEKQGYALNQEITPKGIRMLRIVGDDKQ